MTRGRKITVVMLAVAAIVSTPLFWLLGSPDTGQLAGACVQATAGVVALVWALFQHPDHREGDSAVRTGTAEATSRGRAVSGIRRPAGTGGGPARAEDTGPASANGQGSTAVSGIERT
ncbi:hypothetical protein ABZ410_15820 [Streptomyces cinnamoneus]|uniref:hypothetical protein n=1 Tax=Streptomyces cinnamoneus TaxID=53446 RepID=UPI0033C811D7